MLPKVKYLKYSKYKEKLANKITDGAYKLYCSFLYKIIRKSKTLYYNKIFDKHRNNMRATWNLINKIINSNRKVNKYVHLELNGNPIELNKVADNFNEYFVNLGPNLSNNIISNGSQFTDFLSDHITSSIFISPTTNSEVIKVINSLKNTKSSINKYGSKILKISSDSICQPICTIFNTIVEKGIYPSRLKMACVIPLFKSGSKKDISNYRPISTLHCVNTVIEKLLYSRLISFLDSNNVIVNSQFGFRKGRTTSDAVLNLLQEAYESLNTQRFFGVVSLDLCKAFDTVDYNILLHKLHHYGVRGLPYKILESYLSGRMQYVSVNGVTSDCLPVKVGVPQGSVLGPLLFLVYINDMPQCSTNECNIQMYADDSILFSSKPTLHELSSVLNASLGNLSKWLSSNYLTLNLNKSTYTIITLRRVTSDFNPNVNDVGLSYSETFKFLGVTIDSRLTFKTHINNMIKKISKNRGIFMKLRFLPKNVLVSLYYSLVYPYLYYCVEAWGASCVTIVQPLFILQKKILRLICNIPYYESSNPAFLELRILKLPDIYEYFTIIYSFKVLNSNRAPSLLNNILQLQIIHSHDLRSNQFRLPKVGLIKFKQSPIYNFLN